VRRLLALPLALLLLPGAARAAEPAAGAAARNAPVVVWTGATTNSYFNYELIERDRTADCRAATCDGFRLEVGDGGGDLVVRARLGNVTSDGGNARGGVRITRPDGAVVWHTGDSGPATHLEVTVRAAPAGTYAIDFVNTFVGEEQTYAASAELRLPNPLAASAQAGLALQGVAVSTRTFDLVAARLSASAPLTGVTAVLAHGGRKVATARRTRMDGPTRVVLRARRRLGPGVYLLTVTGIDGRGRRSTAQSAVTVPGE
jgi:hypothetical protein